MLTLRYISSNYTCTHINLPLYSNYFKNKQTKKNNRKLSLDHTRLGESSFYMRNNNFWDS